MERSSYIRDKRSPEPKSATTSHVMSRNRAKDTKPETSLRAALRVVGMTGYRLHPKNVPGRPDICFVGKKLAVFVNGCFWHRCPKCGYKMPGHNKEFWRKKFEANIVRDARKRAELEAKGFTVITIWECEVKKTLDHAVKIVHDAYKQKIREDA